MNSIAISASGIRACHGNIEVLRGLDLTFSVGRWTSIVGPNGGGKSTLLKVLAGLHPCQGEVSLLGLPLSEVTGRARARQMAWLGQGEAHADDLNVFDLVMLGRLPHQTWLASPGAKDHVAVQEALHMTQTWELRERAISDLSGGERQRVLLARALAVQADVLLMDEPLANLDPPHQADWLDIVRELVRSGKTVISVLHEVSLALHADEVLILDKGLVAHQGPCADAFSHRALERVFGQRLSVHLVQGQWVVLPNTQRAA
jgi:iron complex transport system ATP-binding protein